MNIQLLSVHWIQIWYQVTTCAEEEPGRNPPQMSFIYWIWVSATTHFLISMLVSAACRYLRSFLLFPRRGFIWQPSFRLSRVSLLPIFTGFFTLMLCCRPLKICNITVTRRNLPRTTACGRDKVVRRLFIMCICARFSSAHLRSGSAYQHCTTFALFPCGGGAACQRERSNKSKRRICQSYCLTAFVAEAKEGLFLHRNSHKNGPWAFNTIGQLDCGFRLIGVIRELWEIMTSSSDGLSVHCSFFFLNNNNLDKRQAAKGKMCCLKTLLVALKSIPKRQLEFQACSAWPMLLFFKYNSKKSLFMLVIVAGFSFFH